uniref:Uncharacterized protein LOC100373077 n=1 Tax=Saccoglossus kowalevskii TaxID=10224 RepID=A0ABM0GUQ7_SACKO|nr:PREDICTED: uncharacterized protein LOC100373077 [Saccoglossus kowalevskii]
MRSMAVMTMIFNSLNIPLAAHKTLGPSQELEYLGVMINSKDLLAFLPANKISRIKEKISEFTSKKSITKRQLLSLLGHLNFDARVMLPGRSFIAHLLRLASSVSKLTHHVSLNQACRLELSMWKLFMNSWNGIHLFLNSGVISASDLHIYTDTSSTKGFGCFFQGDKWPEELIFQQRDELSMALLELYPIVIAAMLWGQHWSKQRICFNCDNQATVNIIRKGRAASHCHAINTLMRRLTLTAMQHNFTILAQFLPGKQNSIADALSSFQLQKFRELAPDAQENKSPCPPYCEVTQI